MRRHGSRRLNRTRRPQADPDEGAEMTGGRRRKTGKVGAS